MSAKIRRVLTGYNVAYSAPPTHEMGGNNIVARKALRLGTFKFHELVCSTGRRQRVFSWIAELVISARFGPCWINHQALEDAL